MVHEFEQVFCNDVEQADHRGVEHVFWCGDHVEQAFLDELNEWQVSD